MDIYIRHLHDICVPFNEDEMIDIVSIDTSTVLVNGISTTTLVREYTFYKNTFSLIYSITIKYTEIIKF